MAAVVASFLLKETLGFPLPDTFEDVQRMVEAEPWWSSVFRKRTGNSPNEREENAEEMENLQGGDADPTNSS